MDPELWQKSYPPGVAPEVEVPGGHLHELFDAAVARWGELPLCDFLGRRFSYAEIGGLVDRAARGLQQRGVGEGVHVGLYLPNTPHYIVSFFAILKAGGTVVNFSPLYAERELLHQIEDSETELMITLDLAALYPNLARVMPQSRLKLLIVGSLAEVLPFPKNYLFRLAKRKEIAAIPRDAAHLRFAELIDNAGGPEPSALGDAAQAVAVLAYTGGTTGVPKGAMLSHANLAASVAMSNQWSEGFLEDGKERVLLVLPLFHIFALSSVMLATVMRGGELILHPRFEPEAVLKDIDKKRPTLFAGVPTMYTALINHPRISDFDLSSLKACGSGGAPLPVEVLSRVEELTGCPVIEGYGLTETAPGCVTNPWSEKRKRGSIGLPLPGTVIEVRDVDDPDKRLGVGEKGEICVIGPQVTRGYWNKPEETAAALRGGRFHTGDVGYMDPDGFVFLVDRKKDMIISSGFNVYPRTIEEAIYEHPAVAEVTVIGIPDDYRGQAAKAFIKLRDGATLDFEELKSFLADKLGKHEMPAEMELRDELPKTVVGKLSKKELVEEELAKRAAAATPEESATEESAAE